MKNRKTFVQVNAGSMADIAFLLLIFFLVTTVINSDKGILLRLPPKIDQPVEVDIHERNLFKILINSNDQIMIEDEARENNENLRREIKAFVLNNGEDKTSSDNPEKAIISIKTNRGTSYKKYIKILDDVQGAYYEIYAERAGISPETFRKLDLKDPGQRAIYQNARLGIPMNISIAKPTK